MKKAKIRGYKKIRKPLSLGRGVSGLFRLALRILPGLFPLLPFIAIGIVFSLPQTPHLRVSYTYTGSKSHPRYITCDYLGIYGQTTVFGNRCPMIVFIGR